MLAHHDARLFSSTRLTEVVMLLPYQESGMCLSTYLPFCGNIHANPETKGDISHTSPSPEWDASFPTCGESNYTNGEKWNIAARRKGRNWSVSSVRDIVCLFYSFHSWLCVVLCDERREWTRAGGTQPPPPSAHLKQKDWGCFPGGHQGCPNINYTFVHSWLTLGWPWLTPEWKRSSESSPLLQPIPGCQQTAHGPLTHCQPNETSALMKPLWALLVRQQRAMKTLTIHFMDWAVVRTDNMGLINETGLVSWRKGGTQKCNWWCIQAKAEGLVSCWWWWRTLGPPGKKETHNRALHRNLIQPQREIKEAQGG